MSEVAQYKKNAEECRELARSMPRPEDRARLEQMAEAWEQLAAEANNDATPLDKDRRQARELPPGPSGR
ncbi:MAG TPA: hypothetical protein VFD73_00490 [Gemmatimonadales bacterium]|nr:hypothetical protein [Gemmatimonadales bacterium]